MSLPAYKFSKNFHLSHAELIEFMNFFHHLESKDGTVNEESHIGYKMDLDGICFGIACMAM